MKYVFGFLLALVVILGLLALLLSAAADAEQLYVSLSNASMARKVVFGSFFGAAILGAVAAVRCSSNPSNEYWGD